MTNRILILAVLMLACSCKPSNEEFEKNIRGSWYGVGMAGVTIDDIVKGDDAAIAQMIVEQADLLDDFWWNIGDGMASLKPGARPASVGSYKLDKGCCITVSYPNGRMRYWLYPSDFGEWQGSPDVARTLCLIELHDDAQGTPLAIQTAYKFVRVGIDPVWEE